MIDSHCHLEQKDFDRDRKEVVERCKAAGLKAVVTSCAHPRDLQKTLDLVKEFKGFVFATAGIHPEFIKDFREQEVDGFLDLVKENRKSLVGIGEVGLDYHWITEKEWREKQWGLFTKMIGFAKELRLPLVVHSRDACQECIKALEQEDAREVLMHMFSDKELVPRVVENGWHVSVNTLILRSKGTRKIARDVPLEKLLLETDCPWLSPEVLEGKAEKARNEPSSIRLAAEKIAEVKKVEFEKVWRQGGEGAIRFYSLPLRL